MDIEGLGIGDIVRPATGELEMIITQTPWLSLPNTPGEFRTTWIDARQRQQHGTFPREAIRLVRRLSESGPGDLS
jgi:hypothetical protein